MLEHPEIDWIQRTGYPSWLQEQPHNQEEELEDTRPQWELDYLQRQSCINAYARRIFQPRVTSKDKILVYHPDEYRRYLQQYPCDDCKAECFCDQPCEAYLKWYNARLAAARGKTRYEI